ncbi:beta-N-acetylhexosaminidase [Pelagibius sp. Alg239-R121]|uniref:beta-N-acetylhexosaminidase n=1 Tax=Pelagibius sp. Alg239-R121 TaxID=2993448 RepID=UPI0024A724CA|nr:beta-N-acetylhexosaminidase [Pelagibius sp. Alg239-R121]
MKTLPENTSAIIFGCEGTVLTDWERAFFAEANPFGFILFKRNCESPEQLRHLTYDLREAIGREDAPILVDQEGGRVTRLKPPNWRAVPAPGRLGALVARDPATAEEAVRLNTELMAAELRDVGLNVNCIPSLDLALPGAHDVIGDRAFAADPVIAAQLGKVCMDACLSGGVMPVIKHIPGHGRAMVDSHLTLPVVTASLDELKAEDFEAFRLRAEAPWAMTGHVVYTAVDSDRPATASQKVVQEVIRDYIGFNGLLLSDDLSMEALEGNLGQRAAAALAAGCDIALHCNGKPDEMQAVAANSQIMSQEARDRAATAAKRLGTPDDLAYQDAVERLDELLGTE